MTTATGSFALNFAALSDVNPYTNASLTYITADRGKILSAVFRWASGSNFRCAARYNGSVSGNLASKIEFGAAGGGGDAIAAIICDSSGNGYAAVCNSAASISLLRISALAQADVLGSYAPSLVAGDVVELRLNQTTHGLSVHINNGSAVASATDSTVTSGLTPGFMAIADNSGNATIKSFALDGSAASGPTISSISDSTPNYLGSLTITGTGFPTSQSGSASVVIGGVAQTVTWNTSTSCSISSITRGTLKYGVSVDIVVTDASGNASSGYATTLSPQTGYGYVNAATPFATTRLTATPDIANGDQVAYTNASGETVYSDMSYLIVSPDTSLTFEVNDGTGWGTSNAITLTDPPSTTASGNVGSGVHSKLKLRTRGRRTV